jgi:phosphatidylglycerol:prolipoprotein diacylglycerol transferase
MNVLNALATIPWFTLGPWKLGPLTIQGFGLMVAIGVVLAYQLTGWQAQKQRLDNDKMQSLVMAMLISGFIGAHVLDLIFYEPEKLLKDPKILFQFGNTLSSYGGIVGSLLGMGIWKLRNPDDFLTPYADVAAWALPVGWFFGRVGCAVVHDHPGLPSDWALAVVFQDGVARHDLGLYEALWWVVIVAIYAILQPKMSEITRRRPGFFIYLLPLVYAPVRFGLDFLRTADVRYLHLTPAQYMSLGVFVWGAVMMARWKQGKTLRLKVADGPAAPSPPRAPADEDDEERP